MLRRQKHVLSQRTTPFACTLVERSLFLKTPETLSERFLEFPSRVRLGSPKPYNSTYLRLPKHFQNSLLLCTAGDASFFRSGASQSCCHGIPSSSEGLSDLKYELSAPNYSQHRQHCLNKYFRAEVGKIDLDNSYPVRPFLLKRPAKPPKRQGFFIPAEPPESKEEKGTTLKKQKEILARREKTRNSKTTSKGRTIEFRTALSR